jgi:hypothetical protein
MKVGEGKVKRASPIVVLQHRKLAWWTSGRIGRTHVAHTAQIEVVSPCSNIMAMMSSRGKPDSLGLHKREGSLPNPTFCDKLGHGVLGSMGIFDVSTERCGVRTVGSSRCSFDRVSLPAPGLHINPNPHEPSLSLPDTPPLDLPPLTPRYTFVTRDHRN